ncbi:auxin-responsive protein IAA26-like [Mercurialis annua]|uniref:auxin-responsive protein IAA26-like n=1 Tax=Mercurialis annua TaxID=3986 RepID=UPI002160B882|nr:auxin-responsive protein IAA26-like [Mercurialis annua]
MEGSSKNSTETSPQLLDLISRDREWFVDRIYEKSSSSSSCSSSSEEIKKLELRLAPPGTQTQAWCLSNNNNNMDISREIKSHCHEESHQLLSLGSSVWFNQNAQNLPLVMKESSQTCCTKVAVELQHSPANTAVPNTSQKRTAPGPVVGWPPIRSFRKNLATSSSSKSAAIDPQNESLKTKVDSEKHAVEACKKGMFVKINMDGVPIGRKVDLKAYDSYEKLSVAVDELFRDLLAAQRDSSAGSKQEDEKAITGVLDGSGEYTLVYEDNEGDRMLVGDVPWHMFVSTVKRLRVLKSSEISALSLGSGKQVHKLPIK